MGQDTSKGAEVRDVMAKAFKVRQGFQLFQTAVVEDRHPFSLCYVLQLLRYPRFLLLRSQTT